MLNVIPIYFSSNSQHSTEVEDPITQSSIVHRDGAKWVEPVGSGPIQDLDDEDDQRPVKNIGIIGTGDFGRALASKMVQAGYRVHIGSRNPDRNR